VAAGKITTLVVGTLLALAVAGAQTTLEFDRGRVAGGELWRLATGQFVHWSWPMLFADAGVLFVAGGIVERRSRGLLLMSLVVSLGAVAASIECLDSDLDRYRGSSGVACALVSAGLLDLCQAPGRSRLLGAAIGVAFVSKLLWELAFGETVVQATLPSGIVLAPWVHVSGAAAGAACWGVHRLVKRAAVSMRKP
jgi:rhomboid family GlyGly-CTERM serine protease